MNCNATAQMVTTTQIGCGKPISKPKPRNNFKNQLNKHIGQLCFLDCNRRGFNIRVIGKLESYGDESYVVKTSCFKINSIKKVEMLGIGVLPRITI